MARWWGWAAAAAAASLLSAAAPAWAQPPAPLQAALDEAERQGKPVLIELGATGCWPCEYFDERTRPEPVVREQMSRYVLVRLDVDTEEGAEVFDHLGAGELPAFLILDATGVEIARRSGLVGGAELFAEFLDSTFGKALTRGQLTASMQERPDDPEVVLAAARWYRDRNLARAVELYHRAVELDPDDAGGFASRAAWEARSLERERRGGADLLRDAVEYLQEYPGGARALEALIVIAAADAIADETKGDLVAAYVATLPGGDHRRLRLAGYVALAAGALDAALDVAEQLLAAPDPDLRAYFLAAEVHHHRGDREQALAIARQGLERADRAWARGSLESLIRRIEEGDLSSRGVDRVRHAAERAAEDARKPGGDSDGSQEQPVVRARARPTSIRQSIGSHADGRRNVAPRHTDFIQVYFKSTYGLGNSLAAGTRGLLPVRPIGDTYLDALVAWRGHVGGTWARALAYRAELSLGIGARPWPALVGVTVGAAIDRVGDEVPRGVSVPVTMHLGIVGERLRAQAWLRSSWLSPEARQDGAENALFHTDEMSVGFTVSVLPNNARGMFVGIGYHEAMGGTGFSLYGATSLDDLFQ